MGFYALSSHPQNALFQLGTMRLANTKSMDLNLLATFNALIEERSVTGAARRMFVSQPTMSRAVDRLQEMFKDELLVRRTKGYEPTHRALAIHADLEQLLPKLEALFSEPIFNPAKAKGLFRIESSDLGATVLVPGLIQMLAKRAPGVQIDVIPRTGGFQQLETNEVELVLTPSLELGPHLDAETQQLQSQPLFQEKIVCLVRAGHPLAKRGLTFREWVKAHHISLSPMQGARRSPVSFLAERQLTVAKAMERLGHKPDVRVRIPYFVPIGPIVETTDLIATVPLQIARRLKTSRLRVVRAPVEFHGFTYDQVWHSRNDSTPLHKWMRGLIRTLAERIT
jgi:DNA-binding transcriptional LysR family regulator